MFAFLLVAVLIAPLTASSASAAEDDIELVISISEPSSNGDWFTNANTLGISIAIKNSGTTTQSIEYNPSCPVSILMFDGEGQQFTALDEHRNCFNQRRGIDIPAGQTRTLDSFDWNWLNGDEELITSGLIGLEFDFENGYATHTEFIQFQRAPEYIEGLALTVSTSAPKNSGSEYLIGESLFSHLKLTNSGNEPITLPTDDGCRISLNISSESQTLDPTLTDLRCGSSETILVGEDLSLGWFSWDFEDAGTPVVSDTWSLEFSIPSFSGVSQIVTAEYLSGMNIPSPGVDLTISLVGDGGSDGIITDADNLQIVSSLSNSNELKAEIQYNNSCLANLRMIGEDGAIVGDSRLNDQCEIEFNEMKIDPASQWPVDQRLWPMTDLNGCELDDGTYLLVVDSEELGLETQKVITYDGSDSGAECRASMQDTSLAVFSIIDSSVNNDGLFNESITFEIRLDNQIDLDLHWPQDCLLTFTLQKVGDVHPYQVWNDYCSQENNGMQTISAGDGMPFDPYTISFEEMEQGTWTILIETTSTPTFSTQLANTFTFTEVEIEEKGEENLSEESVAEPPEEENHIESWMAEGAWKYVTTEVGGCWILVDIDGFEHGFFSTTVQSWQPRTDHSGAYWVTGSVASTQPCISFNSQITVVDVLSESELVSSEDHLIASEDETPVITIPAAAPIIVAVIASTSLLALLAGLVTQVEWIRLPATKYGLVILGMVRKKKESGGEYQRGRIVAYIEIHRGIHFRALLEALSMSNGQLTHHISVLESDERIWRRKDGRKVRYYPACIDSSTSEEDLPVPVLTPDPNSLQGKILQVLDLHENEILNLSQKELSDKLESSQQLVSYHLKSLESWGLVEKERVAMRYRYRLTDRALVLLNTSNYPMFNDEK